MNKAFHLAVLCKKKTNKKNVHRKTQNYISSVYLFLPCIRLLLMATPSTSGEGGADRSSGTLMSTDLKGAEEPMGS